MSRPIWSQFEPLQSNDSPPVTPPIVIENILDPGLPRGRRAHDSGDIEEVPVAEVIGKSIAAPRAASDGHRERQAVIESPADGVALDLIDDNPAHWQFQAETQNLGRAGAMDPDRMALALVIVNRPHLSYGGVEVGDTIEGQHRGKLLAGERMTGADM